MELRPAGAAPPPNNCSKKMATRAESSASASEEEGDWHTLANRRPSQFLSADQLELWRQVLRDEIEEVNCTQLFENTIMFA